MATSWRPIAINKNLNNVDVRFKPCTPHLAQWGFQAAPHSALFFFGVTSHAFRKMP